MAKLGLECAVQVDHSHPVQMASRSRVWLRLSLRGSRGPEHAERGSSSHREDPLEHQ